jgi:hypothetical protein
LTESPDLVDVEEAELLLVAQHLDRRLAHRREEQRLAAGTGQPEHDLLGKGRLAAAGRAADDVEGQLGQAAAQGKSWMWPNRVVANSRSVLSGPSRGRNFANRRSPTWVASSALQACRRDSGGP